MIEYGNLPKMTTPQINGFKGRKGLVVKNRDSGEFVAFDGNKMGGYSFANENMLDQYIKYGVLPPPHNELIEPATADDNDDDFAAEESEVKEIKSEDTNLEERY